MKAARSAHNRGVRRVVLSAVWVLSTGCAEGSDVKSGASATFGATTTPPPTSASSTATPTSSSDGTDSSTGSDDDDDDSSGSTSAPSDTEGDGTAAPTGSSSSGGPVPSEQPESGMYSDCLALVECIGLTTCMTIVDGAQQPTDGFCTVGGCGDAAADCDASPGGTAQPFCFPIEQDGIPDSICALDCSAGKICPAGMECAALSAGSICT